MFGQVKDRFNAWEGGESGHRCHSDTVASVITMRKSVLFIALKHTRIEALRRGVRVNNLVLLDHLRLKGEFDPRRLPHAFGLVPCLSYT